MTVIARNRDVRAVKYEIGLAVVVELPFGPVHRVMACGTVVVVSTLMRVFLEVTVDAYRGRVTKHMRFVAGLALLVGMLAQQREARQIVIEEHIVLPGRFVVAIAALDALLALMRIVFRVAVIAGRMQGDVEYRFDMAGLTFDFFVRADERMFGIDVVIEHDGDPFLAHMAGIACVAEVTAVIVVFQMTGYASSLHLIGERIFAVTVVAGQVGMPSLQEKIRVPVVIETGIGPVSRLVAVVALFAAAAVVRVILGVATETGRRRALKSPVFVTVEARCLQMLAEQRVVGRVVIEFDLEPARCAVAVRAFGAHEFAMNIVLFMTGQTVAWRIPELLVR